MKNLKLSFICIFVTNCLSAQSQGPYTGGEFYTEVIPGSNKTWINPADAGNNDNIYSTFGNLYDTAGSYTDYLVATSFEFNIPSAAIIDGIIVQIEMADAQGKTSEYSVRIVKAGVIGSTERGNGADFPLTEQYVSYGDTEDLWGETWTDADINAREFGVAIAAKRKEQNGTTEGKIDDIRITIYYHFSTLPVTLTGFNAQKNKKSVGLTWTTTNESNMNHYEIGRSSDGNSFFTIASVSARNQPLQESYTVTDNNPLPGISFYRLKMVERDGSFTYSRITSVQFGTGSSIVLYPAPWKKGTNLNVNNPNGEKLKIFFLNSTGQTVGISSTHSSLVPTGMLEKLQGFIVYKVHNEEGKLLGSGIMLVN